MCLASINWLFLYLRRSTLTKPYEVTIMTIYGLPTVCQELDIHYVTLHKTPPFLRVPLGPENQVSIHYPPLVLAVNMVAIPVLHVSKLRHDTFRGKLTWEYPSMFTSSATDCCGLVKFFLSAQTRSTYLLWTVGPQTPIRLSEVAPSDCTFKGNPGFWSSVRSWKHITFPWRPALVHYLRKITFWVMGKLLL